MLPFWLVFQDFFPPPSSHSGHTGFLVAPQTHQVCSHLRLSVFSSGLPDIPVTVSFCTNVTSMKSTYPPLLFFFHRTCHLLTLLLIYLLDLQETPCQNTGSGVFSLICSLTYPKTHSVHPCWMSKQWMQAVGPTPQPLPSLNTGEVTFIRSSCT